MPLHLVPTPRHLKYIGGRTRWPDVGTFLRQDGDWLTPLLPALCRFLQDAEGRTGTLWKLAGESTDQSSSGHRIVHRPDVPSEGYRLKLDASGIQLTCSDWHGAFYGLQTISQLLRADSKTYPNLEIEDAPARAARGYLLDISRNKVPRRASLCALIDQLAGLKYNQLQLYIEHTFAFSGHETVWGDASPLNAADIQFLDRYAAERAIELVPNFNSFGHFERWLRHPEYFVYAECPYGWRRPDGHGMPWGSTLTPSAESHTFIASLYREYLPLFRSRQCNIGGDEPWELGMGKSSSACVDRGKHVVYLEFIHEIVTLAAEHKDRVQFWADIVLERPETVSRLDPRLTALVWGYEADHPLDAQAAHFARRNLPFYLCPGTSTWNSLGTRLTNARANIEAAGQAAEHHGAEGLLLTDWGDNGHHQPAITSLPPIFLASQAGWSPKTPLNELEDAIAQLGFESEGKQLTPLIFRLGSIDQHFAFRPPNRMPLVTVLSAREDQLADVSRELTTDEVEQCLEDLDGLAREIETLSSGASESCLNHNELAVTVGLLRHAARRVIVHRRGPSNLANDLRREMTVLIGQFENSWVQRNSVGGLRESSGRLRRALESYPSQPARRPAWPPSAWD